MSYQVLARKWRPKQFQSLVGQEPILRMLTNALASNRLHHAYLFSGTRGVGKTTLARLLAKCFNCEVGVTSNPCNQCQTCIAIDQGQCLDVLEVDAASRTKVEDTRELLENVLYPPVTARFKIYLIDEVHMLSNHSFNALLKTLEEPPAHVKFLLATTDPKRLPITILSRCLQFHLKRIPDQQIVERLAFICDEEKLSYEKKALSLIAKAADGSLRDALSLLDQSIAYSEGHLNESTLHAMLGTLAEADLEPLIQTLIKQNANDVFQAAKILHERQPNYTNIIEQLTDLLHQASIHQLAPRDEHHPLAILLSSHLNPETIQLFYQIALLSHRDINLSAKPNQIFEMMLVRMLAFQPDMLSSKIQTPSQISHTPKTASLSNDNADKKAETTRATNLSTKVALDATPAAIVATNNSSLTWREWLPQLELTGMTYALASNCMLKSFHENKVELSLSKQHEPMLNSKLTERIQEAMTRQLKRPTQLSITITNDIVQSPLHEANTLKSEKLNQAKTNFEKDTLVQQLIGLYQGTLDVTLIS